MTKKKQTKEEIAQDTERKNQEICKKLVEREVICCASSMMSELSDVPKFMDDEDYINLNIAYDYEAAANDADWHKLDEEREDGTTFVQIDGAEEIETDDSDDWEELCRNQNIDPDPKEIYEHWVVTGWLRRKLADHGEVTGQFLGFDIWGRCTTGQAIAMDGIIREIASEQEILVGQKYDWSKES